MVFSLKNLLLLGCLLPALGTAQVVLQGKTSSNVTGHVARASTLLVTDDRGGWYEQGVVMTQSGAFNAPYEVSLPLRVTSSSGVFQVRLDNLLTLQHQDRPALQFRHAEVAMAATGETPQPVTLDSRVIRNPPVLTLGEESVGEFLLTVTAVPPEGDVQAVSGTYSGVLSLTFEPVLE